MVLPTRGDNPLKRGPGIRRLGLQRLWRASMVPRSITPLASPNWRASVLLETFKIPATWAGVRSSVKGPDHSCPFAFGVTR